MYNITKHLLTKYLLTIKFVGLFKYKKKQFTQSNGKNLHKEMVKWTQNNDKTKKCFKYDMKYFDCK